ncbi:sensor histidine kinase [Alkalilimnicola ehrlichii]|uniref:sensor histidine kinase n=1 Tax=Alkalilimnicola ehrlichii TaxID=351052 RepID=UPI003BA314AF
MRWRLPALSVRYKLLFLVLFPVLLLMPATLFLVGYWVQKISDDQLTMKVSTDLSVANDAFQRLADDQLDRLARLGESHGFRLALESGDTGALEEAMSDWKARFGFTFLNLRGPDGRALHPQALPAPAERSVHPILRAALRDSPVSEIEIYGPERLRAHSEALAERLRLPILETARAEPTDREVENRAMFLRAAYPVRGPDGAVLALLDGGLLLNGNFDFVDAIRDVAYPEGSLPDGRPGTVTLFLDDVRISTNVPIAPGERALGTRISREVGDSVLRKGEVWIGRAFVVNDWYMSSYQPVVDVHGERVGMLYAGFLEAPFRSEITHGLQALGMLFLVLIVLGTAIAVSGAQSIFSPIERITRVVRATGAGQALRVGPIRSRDELGVLAREFDGMLDLLQARNQQIQEAADRLEEKVQERTAELSARNEELERTIRLLRRTRQQLVVAEKLAALGELTAGVAHEINNPTAVILGNMDVLIQELGEGVQPVRREVDLIIEQVYRIRDIVDNLLQYSRPGDYVGIVSETDVNAVVQQSVDLIGHLSRRREVAVETWLGACRTVRISPRELQQVLVNLLLNALHAVADRSGRVRVATTDWDDRGVVISVSDNGVGIPEQALDHIFNPFYSTRVEGEGTGLGLSISYGLIRRYGGQITVESQEGEGSRFRVWLLSEPRMADEGELLEQLDATRDEH